MVTFDDIMIYIYIYKENATSTGNDKSIRHINIYIHHTCNVQVVTWDMTVYLWL